MADVEQFFKQNVEVKKRPTKYNSFVAPHNKHTYQIDLTFFLKDDFENKQKNYIALTCIDVLSKYATAIPLKNREAPDVIAGVMEAIQKMGGKSKIIYCDDEGAFRGDLFKEFVEGEGIELYRTRGKANFVERFNRTLKDMIFKRLEADEKKGKENLQWVDYLHEVLLTYNNKMKHSATGLTPSEARKERNEVRAKVNIASKARKERLYPEVFVGSKVRILRKKRTGEKERTSHFLEGEYTVIEIFEKLNQKYYKLEGFNRPLMRFELLKV